MCNFGEWQQVGGDVHASDHGATFVRVEMFNDMPGCDVVEIINGYDACGDDWQGPPYAVECSYVDVDAIALDMIRAIVKSCGLARGENDTPPPLPDEMRASIEWHNRQRDDIYALARWTNRELTPYERKIVEECRDAVLYLTTWYRLPYAVRAEAAHSYGGFAAITYLPREFDTLGEAMQAYGVPRSALWQPSEYDAPKPER